MVVARRVCTDLALVERARGDQGIHSMGGHTNGLIWLELMLGSLARDRGPRGFRWSHASACFLASCVGARSGGKCEKHVVKNQTFPLVLNYRS